ncbi:MAG: MCE family protein [Armatimonadetes bacterium]|nr:MCE family protein [Armatimonadota bacterium]
MQAAWKVGLLVVVFVGLLVATYAILERSVFAKPTTLYYIEFADAGGLTTGATVLLAGVRIGSVTDVDLMTARKARVTIAVESQHQIPQGSTAVLPTSLISIGDRRIEIVPPQEAGTVAYLEPGDTFPGYLRSPMESLLPDSESTVKELNATLAAFRELLEDEEMKAGVNRLVAASEKTIESFGDLALRMDGLMADNADALASLLATTGRSLENLEAVSVEVRRLVDSGEFEDRTLALLDNLNEAVIMGQELMAELNAFATDPELKKAITETLKNVQSMSESGTRIADSAEVMAENGVIVSEEAVKLARKANELADEVKELLDRFRDTIDRIGVGGTVFATGAELTADVIREADPGRFRSDVNVTVPLGDQRLTLGLYDAFESNKINLQLGRDYDSRLAVRYGVYAGKAALGVDYALAPRLGLRGDLFGLNDPRLDLRFRYHFGDGVNGWFGVERVFQRPMPVAGVGIKR